MSSQLQFKEVNSRVIPYNSTGNQSTNSSVGKGEMHVVDFTTINIRPCSFSIFYFPRTCGLKHSEKVSNDEDSLEKFV